MTKKATPCGNIVVTLILRASVYKVLTKVLALFLLELFFFAVIDKFLCFFRCVDNGCCIYGSFSVCNCVIYMNIVERFF